MPVKNISELNEFAGAALREAKRNIGKQFNLGTFLGSVLGLIPKGEDAFADFNEIGGELAEASIAEKGSYKEAFDQEIAGSFNDPRDEYDVSAAVHGLESIYSIAKRAGKKEGQEEGIRAALRMIKANPDLLDGEEGNTVARMNATATNEPSLLSV